MFQNGSSYYAVYVGLTRLPVKKATGKETPLSADLFSSADNAELCISLEAAARCSENTTFAHSSCRQT